jgi:hypothetical protein
MTGKKPMDPREVYALYSRAWNVPDNDERRALIDRVWAVGAVYVDDEVPDGLVGRDALTEYISASHREMPGLVVSETSAPKLLGDRISVRWVATQGGEQRYSGIDVVEFEPEGQITRVTNFFDD